MNRKNNELEVLEIKEIPFDEDTLLGVKTSDERIWLAIKKACLDIGLNENQATAERKKIESNVLFEGQWKKLKVKFDSQVRETIFLYEKFVPMWLAQINLTPTMKKTNQKAVMKLLKYQLNAADTLHEAFYKTDEQKEQLHTSIGINGEIMELKEGFEEVKHTLNEYSKKLTKVMDNMTLTTRQQQKINKTAKDRVNHLLGGAHSK